MGVMDFSALREKGAQLSRITDELNVSIDRLEETLNRKFQGRCASVEVPMPSRFPRAAKGEARTDRYALLYWHVNGNWGLWIIDHKAGISRLRSASREVRVQAVNVMPDLIDGLQYEGEGP